MWCGCWERWGDKREPGRARQAAAGQRTSPASADDIAVKGDGCHFRSRYDPWVTFAQCMRQNGFPKFPDPKVSSHTVNLQVSPDEMHSAACQTAEKACRGIMPAGK